MDSKCINYMYQCNRKIKAGKKTGKKELEKNVSITSWILNKNNNLSKGIVTKKTARCCLMQNCKRLLATLWQNS